VLSKSDETFLVYYRSLSNHFTKILVHFKTVKLSSMHFL